MTRWIGREKVRKRFLSMPAKAQAFVRDALTEGADEIIAMQKRLAPVDDGDLRESIKRKWIRLSRAALALQISAGDNTGKPPTRTYAHLVEFGTAPHKAGGMFKGAMHPGTAPQPFFYPAYRSLKKRVKARIRRAFRKAVQSTS